MPLAPLAPPPRGVRIAKIGTFWGAIYGTCSLSAAVRRRALLHFVRARANSAPAPRKRRRTRPRAEKDDDGPDDDGDDDDDDGDDDGDDEDDEHDEDDEAASNDDFGTAISLSADGSTLAVGAPGADKRLRSAARNRLPAPQISTVHPAAWRYGVRPEAALGPRLVPLDQEFATPGS